MGLAAETNGNNAVAFAFPFVLLALPTVCYRFHVVRVIYRIPRILSGKLWERREKKRVRKKKGHGGMW